MNISVFGLGYVGCVSLGCLAKNGHNMIGVDIDTHKVWLINNGKPTIIEKTIDDIIKKQHKKGRIKATTDSKEAILNSEITIVCVGTPSAEQGHPDLTYMIRVAEQIGDCLRYKNRFHTIVIRSTVPPGTNRKVGKIIEEISGKKRNDAFDIVSNPEFLREGSAVYDYYNPPLIVLGIESNKPSGLMKELYKDVDAPIEITNIEVAEIIKYVNNSFHALKIVFANEVGNICKKIGIDSFKVMDLFCKDDKLNISPYYFKPGFAYGGSCLPKDLKALKTISHDNYLDSAVIESIEKSNENHKEIAFKMIVERGKRDIGIIGLGFKPGTDDLRYSPAVELAEWLLGKRYRLRIYDKNVHVSKIVGTNKRYIEEHIPHLSNLITDNLDSLIEESEILVVTHNIKGLAEICRKYPEKTIIDLVGIEEDISHENYEGICW
jgi:GDP-mannose 6-dehydrogenase